MLDEHLVRDAERARTELDTVAQVGLRQPDPALEAAPVIADLSSWLADVAGRAGIAWERLFDAPEEKSLRTLRYELDRTEATIAKLQGRIDNTKWRGAVRGDRHSHVRSTHSRSVGRSGTMRWRGGRRGAGRLLDIRLGRPF